MSTFAELQAGIVRARAAGDLAALANLLEQKAARLAATGAFVDAREAWVEAASCFGALGEPARRARAVLALAEALDGQPAWQGQATTFFARAAQLAVASGEPELELMAYERQVTSALLEGEPLRAIAALQDTIAQRLEALGQIRGLVDVYRQLAALHAAVRRTPARARDDLRVAQSRAERTGDPELVLLVRLERRATGPGATLVAAGWEDWQSLVDDLGDLPDALLHGHPHLQRAWNQLEAGALDEAEDAAAKALTAALQGGRPALALGGVLLRAEAQEARGEGHEVLRTLHEGRLALARRFGVAWGHGLTAVMHALRERWGEERHAASMSEAGVPA